MRWLGLLMMIFIFSGCYSGYESPENKKYEKPNTSFHEDL